MSLKYQTEEFPPDEPVGQAPDNVRQPLPIYSLVLIAAFGIVAVVQFATGLDQSIYKAGFDKAAFLSRHEYWRIFTGAAMHNGILHVGMNAYAFYSFGRIFEMLSNRAHLAIVFILSAIGGGVLSLLMLPDGISVGASGGIVGLIGYLAVYAFRRRDFVTPEFRRSLLTNIGFILIYGLLLYRVIDNYGHIGGLVTGALYALIQVPSDPFADPRVAVKAVEAVGLVSIGLYIAVCGFCILLMTGLF